MLPSSYRNACLLTQENSTPLNRITVPSPPDHQTTVNPRYLCLEPSCLTQSNQHQQCHVHNCNDQPDQYPQPSNYPMISHLNALPSTVLTLWGTSRNSHVSISASKVNKRSRYKRKDNAQHDLGRRQSCVQPTTSNGCSNDNAGSDGDGSSNETTMPAEDPLRSKAKANKVPAPFPTIRFSRL